MEDLQAKLEQYRVRKRRKETVNAIKERIKTGFKKFIMSGSKKEQEVIPIEDESETEEADFKLVDKVTVTTFTKQKIIPESFDSEEDVEDDDDNISTSVVQNNENKVLKYTLYLVYLLFWITLYIIAIELQFGIVFLMISALFFICLNTRTGKKKENEISAYSVFNKNCEAIDGTLNAEQLEKQLFFGSALGR